VNINSKIQSIKKNIATLYISSEKFSELFLMNSFNAGKILIDDAELSNVITGSKTEKTAPAINPVKMDKIIEKNTAFL